MEGRGDMQRGLVCVPSLRIEQVLRRGPSPIRIQPAPKVSYSRSPPLRHCIPLD